MGLFGSKLKDVQIIKTDSEYRFVDTKGHSLKSIEELNYDQKAILSNKNYELKDDGLVIAFEDIYDFYYIDSDMLGGVDGEVTREFIVDYKSFDLPPLFKGYMHVRNHGNYSVDKQVKYPYIFHDIDNDLSSSSIQDNYLEIGEEDYILPKEMYDLAKTLRDYNNDGIRNRNDFDQYSTLTQIKEFLKDTHLSLDKRLGEMEEPILIDGIEVTTHTNNEDFYITPKISEDEEIQKQFEKQFNLPKDRFVYSINNRKVVFKKNDSVQQVHKFRHMDSQGIKEILDEEHPLNYVEGLDLMSNFSPRVKGIGYISLSKLKPFLSSGENWFDTTTDAYIPEYRDMDGEVIKFTPDKLNYYEELLKEESDVVKVELEGTDKEILMNHKELEKVVQDIKNAEIEVDNIRSLDIISDLYQMMEEDPEKDYYDLAGKYVNNSSDLREKVKWQQEYLEIKEQGKKNTGKEIGLLIYDNEEDKSYMESFGQVDEALEYCSTENLKSDIKLFTHQEKGVAKMQSLYKTNNLNGLLLADDMGLGKTLQVITMMGWILESKTDAKFMIVAPKILVKNWIDEFHKFAKPGLFKVFSRSGRLATSPEVEAIILQEIMTHNIILTTYESLYINHITLGKVPVEMMVCDEVQKAKNSSTQVGYAIKTQNAKFKIACTATPIENSTEDLWNIMDFCKPGLLGTQKQFKGLIKQNRSDEVDEKNNFEKDMRTRLGGFVVRREKKTVFDKGELPEKRIFIDRITASKLETEYIEDALDQRALGESPLVTVGHLIRICSHPYMYKMESNSEIKKVIRDSSKMTYLKGILDEIKKRQEKVLVFADLHKIQDFIVEAVQFWYGITPSVINGNTTDRKREQALDTFKSKKGFNIIILSTEVAGVGLTITEANNVIHYLRKWNPAKENQATDRVYRIGQDKDVNVYIPMITFHKQLREEYPSMDHYLNEYSGEDTSGGSPDEKLNALLVKKNKLLSEFFFAVSKEDTSINMNNEWNFDVEKAYKKKVEKVDSTTFDRFSPLLKKEKLAGYYNDAGYQSVIVSNRKKDDIDVIAYKDSEVILLALEGEGARSNLEFVTKRFEKSFKEIKAILVTRDISKMSLEFDMKKLFDNVVETGIVSSSYDIAIE